ncbi:hypothetical protein [Yokenella regensburgei]|uniref:hypothetical protein n=1 Tax=Yokenella regensburgei TaxID=158877 RepID=UPI0013760F8F|nr:hypothetical protein [Yokenella regensburgei]KAF1366530.1 hypothetical protein FHR25_004993 [Yokenella regensburgei]
MSDTEQLTIDQKLQVAKVTCDILTAALQHPKGLQILKNSTGYPDITEAWQIVFDRITSSICTATGTTSPENK